MHGRNVALAPARVKNSVRADKETDPNSSNRREWAISSARRKSGEKKRGLGIGYCRLHFSAFRAATVKGWSRVMTYFTVFKKTEAVCKIHLVPLVEKVYSRNLSRITVC
jgi:hypothetical protein